MLYAQFYSMSTGYGTNGTPVPIEACGDRSVIILDARVKPETNGRIAAAECVKRGFVAWSIHSGRSFTDSRRVSGPWFPNNSPADNTASAASFGA